MGDWLSEIKIRITPKIVLCHCEPRIRSEKENKKIYREI